MNDNHKIFYFEPPVVAMCGVYNTLCTMISYNPLINDVNYAV